MNFGDMNFGGIDEAGLGPLLGPLSGALCRSTIHPEILRELLSELNIWPGLSPLPSFGASRVFHKQPEQPKHSEQPDCSWPIAESKMIYRNRSDFARLELLALSLYGASAEGAMFLSRLRPSGFSGSLKELLLSVFSPQEQLALRELPWYQGLFIRLFRQCSAADRTVALEADPALVWQQAEALQRRLALHGGQNHGQFALSIIGGMFSERQFNQHMERLNNKNLLLRELIGQLLDYYAKSAGTPESAAAQGLQACCTVDRLGSLKYYLPWLQTLFPKSDPPGRELFAEDQSGSFFSAKDKRWTIRTLREEQHCSEYLLHCAPDKRKPLQGFGQSFRVRFQVKADRCNILCAIASIWAKYRRELLLRQFNNYWQGRCPGIPLTSGYHRDAGVFMDYLRREEGGLPADLRRDR